MWDAKRQQQQKLRRMLRDKLLTKYSETTNEVYVNGLGHMGDVFTPKLCFPMMYIHVSTTRRWSKLKTNGTIHKCGLLNCEQIVYTHIAHTAIIVIIIKSPKSKHSKIHAYTHTNRNMILM